MTNWPDVTIGVITYDRPREFGETINALVNLGRLQYPVDRLRWLIADDHSPNDYAGRIRNYTDALGLHAQVISTPRNSGWGANANNLLQHVQTDYLFLLEDDYVLGQDLDLRRGVALMEAKPDVGMVRYRGTAGDHVVFHQFEADVTDHLPDLRYGYGVAGKLPYLQLDSGSPTTYLYSNGPHLRHRRFTDFYGVYPEGLKLGQTEEAYCHQVKDRMTWAGAPAITILPEWIPMMWNHIGHSYQLTEMDK